MPYEAFYDNLHALFNPSCVAVVGASDKPDKLGFHVMKSLIKGGFEGRIVPVNPGSGQIMGLPSFASILECEDSIDLAVIVIPAKGVPEIFEACGEKGVRGIVLITAGFKEIDDPTGGELQTFLAEIAQRAKIPVIGPNTFGMINLRRNLNASFTPEFSMAGKGRITLVSQSGGISHLLAFMAMKQNLGLNKVVGLGNRLNVDFGEMVTYLMEDEQTDVIVLYIEGMDEPRALMEAAKAGGRKKPILALKAGSAKTGDQASLSHTGSMAGKQEVYEGALRQSGVFPVDDTQTLLDLAQALSICPLPKGPRVAVLTGQAGPGMAACDVCETEGLEIVSFGSKTQTTINELLPPLALRTNPVDMGPAWYNSSAVQGIVKAVMEDDRVDAIIILMMFASANRETVPNLSDLLIGWKQEKPIISCFNAPPGIWDQDVVRLQDAGAIVNLPTPERAARAMARLWQYGRMCDGRFGKEGIAPQRNRRLNWKSYKMH